MLIAADDALTSAAEATQARDKTSKKVDKKFKKAIHLLSDLEKDFPLTDPTRTSDPNIGGTVTREAKMSSKPKSPSAILSALKRNLHAKVKLISHSFYCTSQH